MGDSIQRQALQAKRDKYEGQRRQMERALFQLEGAVKAVDDLLASLPKEEAAENASAA